VEKIIAWGNHTNHHKLTWGQAQIASKSTIGRTLQYSLPATTFDEKECQELQKTYLQAILGKIGVVRTAPTTLAIAPVWLGGFGLMSFEIEQLINHVGMILQHGHDHNSITGALLRASLEYYALESGLPGEPLQLPEKPYTTQRTWVFNTITAMRKHKVKVFSDIPGLSTWMTNDEFIMLLLPQVTDNTTLHILNKVRMYLRVVTMLDLLTADGKQFDINVISGNRNTGNPNPSYYRYTWPSIPPPSKQEKETWSKYICMALNISMGYLERPNLIRMQWKKRSYGTCSMALF
jgi:hypothetical protein